MLKRDGHVNRGNPLAALHCLTANAASRDNRAGLPKRILMVRAVGHLLLNFFVGYDNKSPVLHVLGRWRLPGRLEYLVKLVLLNGLILISPA
jgi:hypothetical protein